MVSADPQPNPYESEVDYWREAYKEQLADANRLRAELEVANIRLKVAHGLLGREEEPHMPFVVTFHNPAAGTVIREFATREEAEARVEHYREKYGAFPGFTPAEIEEVS